MEANAQRMYRNAKEQNNKMDRNAQRMYEMRDDMQTQRGEIQSMGLNLQASLEEVKCEMRTMDWKMAPARGGTTMSGGSVTVVRTAMETGKVAGMSDAVIIGVEAAKLEQGMTEIVTGHKGRRSI